MVNAGLMSFLVMYITLGRRQSKTLLTIDEADQKSIETVFSIVICRRSGDKWKSRTLFLAIFDLCSSIVVTFSIAVYPGCIYMWASAR